MEQENEVDYKERTFLFSSKLDSTNELLLFVFLQPVPKTNVYIIATINLETIAL